MKVFIFLVLVCKCALSENMPVPTPVPVIAQATGSSDNSKSLLALFAGIFAVNSSMSNFNSAAVNPSNEICDRTWEPPQKMDVDEPVVSATEVKVDGKVVPSEDKSDSAFKSNENPNQQAILSQGCIQETLDILEKCFPPMADKLKRSEIKFDDLKKMPHEGFRIKSYSKEITKARNWDFHHQNRAKQDTALTVMDGYHYGKGKVYAAELMFFPRKQVPQYATKGNRLEVTLATGEIVNFDQSSGVIQSGVLKENKPVKGQKPDIKYDGSGIMIQMMGIDGAGKSYIETATDAVIYKKGFEPCTVPASDLWPQRKSGKANNFKFASDESLDKFLKQTCKFSL